MMRFDKNARIAWTLVVVQEGERPVLSRTVTVRFAETLRGSLSGTR